MDIGTAKPDLATRAAHAASSDRHPRSGDELLGRGLRARRERGHGGDLAAGPSAVVRGRHDAVFPRSHAGLAELPEADLRVRAEIDAQAASGGWAAVHREFAARRSARGGAHSRQRSAAHSAGARGVPSHRRAHLPPAAVAESSVFAGVDVLEFAVAPLDRAILHRRIEARFLAMLAAGFLDEVRTLARKKRSDCGTSVDARGRISASMAISGGIMRVGRGQRTSDCGDAAIGQTSADVAEAA